MRASSCRKRSTVRAEQRNSLDHQKSPPKTNESYVTEKGDKNKRKPELPWYRPKLVVPKISQGY